MADPTDTDRNDALLRRLYDEPDADSADGELARDVESYRRVRGAIADYARATEVEPPSRGVDELLAAARQRVSARSAAVPPEAPGLWARLRAWLQPIAAHPALASAAMVVVVAVVGGVLYVNGRAKVADQEAHTAEVAPAIAPPPPPMSADKDDGVVARLDDGSGTAAIPPKNQAVAPGSGDDSVPTGAKDSGERDRGRTSKGPRPRPGEVKSSGGGGGDGFGFDRNTDGHGDTSTETADVAVGQGVVVTEGTVRRDPAPVIEPSSPPTVGTDSKPQTPPTRAPTAGSTADPAPPDSEEAETLAPGKENQKKEPAVLQLTRQARTAAKSGDCGVVRSIGGRVKKLDAGYYKQSFALDVTIKKCL